MGRVVMAHTRTGDHGGSQFRIVSGGVDGVDMLGPSPSRVQSFFCVNPGVTDAGSLLAIPVSHELERARQVAGLLSARDYEALDFSPTPSHQRFTSWKNGYLYLIYSKCLECQSVSLIFYWFDKNRILYYCKEVSLGDRLMVGQQVLVLFI